MPRRRTSPDDSLAQSIKMSERFAQWREEEKRDKELGRPDPRPYGVKVSPYTFSPKSYLSGRGSFTYSIIIVACLSVMELVIWKKYSGGHAITVLIVMVILLPLTCLPFFILFKIIQPLINMKLWDNEKRLLSDWADFEIRKKNALAEESRRKEIEESERKTRENYWRSLTGIQFEKELAILFRTFGYEVITTSITGDEGVDLILKKDSIKAIVQCKAHNKPLGPAVVRELYGVMIHENANLAILATLNGVTVGGRSWMRDKPIRVIELNDILKMSKEKLDIIADPLPIQE